MPARILIVEDDPYMAARLRVQLEHQGHEVVACVGSSAAALAEVERACPDLVLMDIVLEGEADGVDAAARIQARCDVPVLYLTAHDDTETVARAKLTGPLAYLLKPVSERELELTIEIALCRHAVEAELRRSEQLLQTAQRIGGFGSWDWDIASGRVLWSPQTFAIFGRDPASYRPDYDSILDQVHPDDRPGLEQALAAALAGDKRFSRRFRIVTPEGEVRSLHAEGELECHAGGRPKRMVGVVHDVTLLSHTEAELWRLAYHDPLTGLPNRRLLEDRLQQAIGHARRDGSQVGLLLLDLDHFKPVNDRHGHAAGDELLQAVARRLRAPLREEDTLCRLGGDEFVVMVSGLREGEAAAARIAHKLLEALAEPFVVGGESCRLGASIGVALYPGQGGTPEELLAAADAAMYDAKRSGRNAVRLAKGPVPS